MLRSAVKASKKVLVPLQLSMRKTSRNFQCFLFSFFSFIVVIRVSRSVHRFVSLTKARFIFHWTTIYKHSSKESHGRLVRLEFESVHQVCDCFVVPLSLTSSQGTSVPAANAIRRFGQRCARVRRLRQRPAILRAVDEFRSRDAPKGGRETADAICIAFSSAPR